MANTFLNTGRTAMATSNPQANIQQIQPNNQAVVQNSPTPATSNQPNTTVQSSTQTSQNNAVNPITIPIQIQPQVATQNEQMQPQTNIQSLQTQSTNNDISTANNPAPTPQTYQGQNTNNNVVDFNQIYSSYQGAFGNNSSTSATGSSGIKKTSIGTTIVTPTTSNLNTVQGQYQSAYADTINSLIGSMITNLETGFQYDPTKDTALQVATEYAANSTLQSLAGSGVLNSSATAERVARVVSELIPQYEQLAYNRWTDYLGQLADTAQLVMNYDAQQFEYWKDDNASAILGVPVGTLSGEARLAKEQQEFELAKMREQAQIEYENNKALYQLKSELDKQQQEYTYQLEQKYGSSKKSSTTSLSTYQDIINNRWADYDEFSRKYSVSDNTGLYNYLVTEYSAGRLSSSDLANLTAMYNVRQPSEADTAREERKKYLASLSSVQ